MESLPDVVLCDIGLPDIDGYEVARRLRGDERTAHISLVAVSGYGQGVDRLRSAEAGLSTTTSSRQAAHARRAAEALRV